MIQRRLLVLALSVLAVTVSARSAPVVTVLAHGPLVDLAGVTVGQVTLEEQEGRSYLHVREAGPAAGAALEVLLSKSLRPLRAGDHSGPGSGGIRAGLIERAEVRYVLPAALGPRQFRTVWIWCPSVRLPSARALLTFR